MRAVAVFFAVLVPLAIGRSGSPSCWWLRLFWIQEHCMKRGSADFPHGFDTAVAKLTFRLVQEFYLCAVIQVDCQCKRPLNHACSVCCRCPNATEDACVPAQWLHVVPITHSLLLPPRSPCMEGGRCNNDGRCVTAGHSVRAAPAFIPDVTSAQTPTDHDDVNVA